MLLHLGLLQLQARHVFKKRPWPCGAQGVEVRDQGLRRRFFLSFFPSRLCSSSSSSSGTGSSSMSTAGTYHGPSEDALPPSEAASEQCHYMRKCKAAPAKPCFTDVVNDRLTGQISAAGRAYV